MFDKKDYRNVGDTSLKVSPITLGTMTYGDQNTQAEAFQQLDFALEKGINSFDLAEMYPVPPKKETCTRTETIFGNWLTKQKRDHLILSTKIAGPRRNIDWIRGGNLSLNKKNILQSNKIANFLSANSKNNPFVLTISSIFSFFKKVLIYKQISNLDRSRIASTLKINPYFINQYQTASQNYNYNQLKKIFKFIEEYELRSKGIGNYNTSTDSLLKELIFKILHA